MGRVVWAPSALADIESIAEYISRDSADRAALFVTRIIEAAEKVQKQPRSGRVVPEIGVDVCREIVYGAYRVMYRIEGEEIWITGIVHGARNWKPG